MPSMIRVDEFKTGLDTKSRITLLDRLCNVFHVHMYSIDS